MPNNKELNNAQLEKVAGGGATSYRNISDINWLFSKNETAYVELTDGTKVEGKVTKKSVIGMVGMRVGLYTDCYYVESTLNTNVNGWYAGDKFNNKTVSINSKFSVDLDPIDW